MGTALRIGAVGADGEPFEIRKSDIHEIETLLWRNSVLCYQADLPARLRRSLFSNAPINVKDEKYLLLDLNIVSDIANLFLPPTRDLDSRKVAVALVLFIRLCKYTPAALSALQEYESQHPGLEAYNDLVAFGGALASPIEKHLDLLNGRCLALLQKDIPVSLQFKPYEPHEAKFDFSSMWFVSYIAVLKLARLERQKTLNKMEKMEAFLRWVHEELFFTPPLLLVASQFLGVRREQSVLKGILTSDVQRLKANVRNAAWDVNILLEWHIKGKKSEFCVLATRDVALRKIAVRMRRIFVGAPNRELLILAEDWPNKREADRLYAGLRDYQADLENPDRPANKVLSRQYYQAMMHDLEIDLQIVTE